MIYIKRHNLCFIRVPKTGSQSLFYFLYRNMYTSEDLITKSIVPIDYHELHDKNTRLKLKKIHPTIKTAHTDVQYLIDNNFVDQSANFLGVIRNPLEKQLSLYMYRLREGAYGNTLPSPKHFQSLFRKGVLLDRSQHHMQSQHSFLEYNGTTIGQWWLFDHINIHVEELIEKYKIKVNTPFVHINKSPGDKRKLIKNFYTDELKQDVFSAYQKDFELYNQLKHHNS
jgi:hypothetical protein